MNIRRKTFVFTLTLILTISSLLYIFIGILLPYSYAKTSINKMKFSVEEFVEKNSNTNSDVFMSRLSEISLSLPSTLDIKFEKLDDYNKDAIINNNDNSNNINYKLSLSDGDYILRAVYYPEIELLIKDEMNRIFPLVLIIVFIFAVIFSYVYSKFITTPILNISKTITCMKSKDSNILIEVNTNDEIGDLSREINSLYIELIDTIDKINKEHDYKKNFLLGISHKLKTPVSSIMGMLEGMLENIPPYDDRDAYLRKCRKLTGLLANDIRDLLDIAKLEALPNQKECINLNDFINGILYSFEHLISEKGIKFIFQIEEDATVITYKNIFHKAVINIVENSIKYSQHNSDILVKITKDNLIISNYCEQLTNESVGECSSFLTNKLNSDGIGLYIVEQCLNTLNMKYKIEKSYNKVTFSINFNGGQLWE